MDHGKNGADAHNQQDGVCETGGAIGTDEDHERDGVLEEGEYNGLPNAGGGRATLEDGEESGFDLSVSLQSSESCGLSCDGAADPGGPDDNALLDNGSPQEEHTAKGTALPSIESARAIESLQPEQLISATAIELVLSKLLPSDSDGASRILDPGYIKINDLHSIKLKPPPRVQAKHQHLVVPVHYNTHRIFADVDLINQVISCYNSNTSEQVHALIKEALSTLAGHLHTGLDDSMWTFQATLSIQQDNVYDRAIIVLVDIIRIILFNFRPPNLKVLIDSVRAVSRYHAWRSDRPSLKICFPRLVVSLTASAAA